MSHEVSFGNRVSQVKNSLDQLQNSLFEDECSDESMMRLSKALNDINEEVMLLKNMMQLGRSSDSI
ncbi:hypothetical protein [Thalassotalea atypica]|uniref:hypothetical protein n=1 Tax=Thalassotalea atypica TaxID=2054316 RepID=UPI002572432C|nr:hypothetical protein [Thalassotalea atypica]